jgi:hypothetical protein
MNAIERITDSERYARCIQTSKRVRWDIEDDVICGRRFDTTQKFLPDGLSLAEEFTSLSDDEKRFVSQIQGRTYADIFGLVERFINAKVLELSHEHWFGDQVALEALVRFSDEELKHQALFRRIDEMVRDVLPDGYRFDVDPNAVARAVLGKSTWAVLALTLDIELFTQLHYRESIEADTGSPNYSGTSSSITGRRRASTPSSMSSNGCATTLRSRCSNATAPSTNSSNWSPPWTASCKPRPKPMPATSWRGAAARSAQPRHGQLRPHS